MGWRFEPSWGKSFLFFWLFFFQKLLIIFSVLKRPGQLTSPPQYHHQQNIHKNEEKGVGSVQQIYNKYSGINYKNSEQEQPQTLNLQNQFSKMQQQIQKQRGLTRGIFCLTFYLFG